MNVDDLFIEIGQFGPYQVRQYLLLALPILFSAYQTITFVFTTAAPDFRCFIPECEDKNSTEFWTPWLNSTIPFKNGVPNQCVRYKPFVNHTSNLSELCSVDSFYDEEETIGCDSYVFSPDETTVASEFGIVCEDNNWKIFLVIMITYIGFFIGMPIAGILSDRFGRRGVMIFSWFLQSVIAITRSFATNFETFLILQSLGALTCGAYNAGFVMALEALGPAVRVLGNALICCFHSLGQVNVGLTMWYTKDWRLMNRILFGPGLLCPVYFWLVPESVRWLISKGKADEAVAVFRKIAVLNNRHLTRQFENNVKSLAEVNIVRRPTAEERQAELNEQIGIGGAMAPVQLPAPKHNRRGNNAQNNSNNQPPSSNTIAKILKSKILMIRLFYCVIVWASISMLFYALSLKSVTVSGDKYLNFVLAVIVEIPGYLTTYVLMEIMQIGRKTSLHITITLTGLCCFLFFVIQECECLPTGEVIIFLIAKLSITFSFAVVYIYTAEMFPTEIRNSVLSICSMSGHVGSIFAPATLLLIKRYDPSVVWGIVAIISGLMASQFPETKDSRLPETIADAEQL